ncbi:MAG: hypothetical protein AAB682_02530 [Patescibacteria group bacterium]
MIRVEVDKNANENSTSLLRRFTKRVQGSGNLKRARARRYFGRPQSILAKKKLALRRMVYRAKKEADAKLGIVPIDPRNRKSH